MLLSLELRTDRHLAKVVLHGAASDMPSDRFHDVLRALTSVGISRVIVDLHYMQRIDIQVVAALSQASRTLAAQNGYLRIAGAREPVKVTLSRFGVTDRVELFRSTEEAGWSSRDVSSAVVSE